jgi:hypothetical protein
VGSSLPRTLRSSRSAPGPSLARSSLSPVSSVYSANRSTAPSPDRRPARGFEPTLQMSDLDLPHLEVAPAMIPFDTKTLRR